ncbi:MAG TPA: amino acid adenylation domain-containing protein, partial [Thermoanaerobaculia bacterium]|nr:amino acid adenylation domain-containing protein [Thermoanaerobaculia bacterium]
RLRETSTAAYGHQDLPFEMLVEELAVERSLSRNPVCQVMFGFHNFPLTAVEARGLRLSPFTLEQVETGTAKFDLTLFAWEHGAGVDGMVEYNGDLFDRATLVRAVSHFEELLRAIASAPGTRVSLLRMLAPGELAQLLREWNDTAASYPREVSLQQVFEAQAARDPEAVALVSAAGAVTYGELNARANRLAARLQALGAGVESRVGVCLERSVAAIVTVVAVIKAGAAYVPLDPQYPAVRRELMMQLAEVSALVTRRPLLGIWAGSSVPALCIDEMGEDGPAGENPASVAGPDNLAYVIFTSGSTGVPKATAVPHRGVLRLVLGAGYVRYGPEQVLLQLAPLAFDASTFEIWGALLHGGRLAILPPGTPTLDELAAAIERHGVSLLFLTSGLFRHFIEARIERLQGLEQLLSGGEAMPVAAAQRVLQALPGTRFANIYGPTENTVYTAWCPLSGPQDVGAAVAIGRPIDNTSLHLLDRRLEPVPIGIGGELYCGGDGVVRGYLGRPDLTAERFVPDPFGVGGRLYRTGDRARLLADGRVEFLGRIDQQIKIRGFRVELEEIELVLASHPAVRAAAVRAHEMGPGDRRLVGYVVAVPPAADPAGESMRPVAEQVASWARLFDQVYQREPAPAVPDFNIVGWESSYTGAPIPAEEMREWLDDTVERIIALGPRRVLEIGCGSGLLLLRIAPSCAAYVGTDISRQALDGLALEVAARGLSQVELLECAAADFSRIEPGSMDCVVLNSVVQYFPSVDYLADVLERAVAAVAPDGWVFIGDVRSLPLLQAFHASVTLFRAASEETLGELQERAAQAVEREPELAVHPAFFHALRRRLPQIGGVRVEPKRGKSHNELSKFRYQVLLRIGEPARQGPPAGWEDGAAFAGGAPALRRRLVEEQPAVLALANLRNSRVAADLAAARLLAGETAGFAAASGASSASETAAGLRQRLAVAAADCLDPEDVRTVAAGVGYAVALGCASDAEGGCFEAVLLRLPETHLAIAAAAANAALDPGTVLEAWTSEPAASRWPLDELANDPLRARRREELDTELRGYLEARLPAYMVPATLLQLESMPLTPSGKVDRKALPAPGTPRAGTRLVAAADAVERALVKIWERVLGVPVGVTDRFFDLGGHSLLAIRLMAEIRGRFGVEPPLTDLFLYPTVREFAVRLRHPARAGGGARVDLRPAGRLPPLFLVQPGRGDAFCYLDLAQALAGEHPVIGLQSPPPDSGTHRGRIEAMAAAQLGELRRCRPTGPYLLGGWSLGGVVAYEMACQLAREGDEVDLLALFDSSPGSAGDLRPPPDDALLLQLFGGVPLPALEGEGRGLDLDRQLQHLLAVPRLARLLPADTGAAELRPLFEEFRDNALGLWHYRATPYRGRVLLFRAARSLAPEPALGAADPRLGWDELCPSLELREVPGDHYSMLRSPQVEVLAGMLAVELAAVGAPAAAAVAAGGEGR